MALVFATARRCVCAAIAALVAGAFLVPAAASGAGQPCNGVASAGAWTSIDTPIAVNAFALVAGRGLLVSDGRVVYASNDAGCTWRQRFVLPTLPTADVPFANERIVAIAAPTSSLFYLATTGPHVVVSRDGGRTWAASESGLTPGGDPVELVVPPADASSAYLLVQATVSDAALNNGVTAGNGTTASASVLYRSGDAGRSWTRAALPSSSVEGPTVTNTGWNDGIGKVWDVAVAPGDPNRLWAAASAGVFTSPDGGRTWAPALARAGAFSNIRAIDVPAAGPVEVIAVDPVSGVVYRIDAPASRNWNATSWPGFRTDYANVPTYKGAWLAHTTGGTVFGSGPKGVFELTPPSKWRDVSPIALGSDNGTLVDPTPGADETIYARPTGLGTSLLRFSVPAATASQARSGSEQPLGGPLAALAQATESIGSLRTPRPARLDPPRATIRLRSGESVTKAYTLSLPARPTPADVFFLLDTTSSMSDSVRALARSVASIATRLRADGIDVWTGLGEFRTYPYPGEGKYNYAYRRDVELSPPGRDLARALLDIEGEGQSGSNLTALFQAATGAGQDVAPPDDSEGDIPSGQDAGFRPGALHVIVHAADSAFASPERGDGINGKYPAPTWPGPGFEETIAALNERDIRQVGAAIGFRSGARPTDSIDNAWADLDRVASGTSTFAPARGVDCDGNGRRDLHAGQPLVCPVPEGHAELLEPAIVGLVEGVRDVAPVRLVVTDDSPVVESIAPAAYPAVNLRTRHSLEFDVTYTCPDEGARRAFAVDLSALVRDKSVASSSERVVCAPSPAPPRLDAAGRPEPNALAAAALPPPVEPPPPPVDPGPASAPVPQPQPQPNPNPNPQVQPRVAAAAQRQPQTQVALVQVAQQMRQELGMEHAMSRVEARPDPLAEARYLLGAGVLTMIMLYGYATLAVRTAGRSVRR